MTAPVPGQKFAMRVHDDPRHIMKVFTDMYSNPALAVVREYTMNACDANVAAGNYDTVEVSLPTTDRPVFRVVDHGLGLSTEEITVQYASYGYSSKQGEEDTVGKLGMGCKAALTFGHQHFTVRSVNYDEAGVGTAVEVKIARDESGGSVEVVKVYNSQAPSGTEVIVPVPDYEVPEFNATAHEFYSFFDYGTVLIDGEDPDYIFDESSIRMLDDGVALLGENALRNNSDYLIMGNVAYPVDFKHRLLKTDRNQYSASPPYVLARVPIGSVEITPNREALHYTADTLDTLDDIRTWVRATVFQSAQFEINECADRPAALKVAEQWRSMEFRYPYTYQSELVPERFELDTNWDSKVIRWEASSMTDKATTKGAKRLDAYSASSRIHIVGFNGSSLGTGMKRRILMWLADNDDLVESFKRFQGVILYSHQRHENWLPADAVVDYQTIRDIKLPKTPRVGGHGGGVRGKSPKYRLLNEDGQEYTLESWGGTRTRVALESTKLKPVRDLDVRRRLGSYARDHNAAVFVLTPNKYAKVMSLGSMVSVEAWLATQARQVVTSYNVIDAWKRHYSVGYHSVLHVLEADPADILDPQLRAFALKVRATSSYSDSEFTVVSRLCLNFGIDPPKLPNYEAAVQRLSDEASALENGQYPRRLWSAINNVAEGLEIINALYRYRNP